MNEQEYGSTSEWSLNFEGDHHHVFCKLEGPVTVNHDEISRSSHIRMEERDAGRLLSCLLANWHRLYGDHR